MYLENRANAAGAEIPGLTDAIENAESANGGLSRATLESAESFEEQAKTLSELNGELDAAKRAMDELGKAAIGLEPSAVAVDRLNEAIASIDEDSNLSTAYDDMLAVAEAATHTAQTMIEEGANIDFVFASLDGKRAELKAELDATGLSPAEVDLILADFDTYLAENEAAFRIGVDPLELEALGLTIDEYLAEHPFRINIGDINTMPDLTPNGPFMTQLDGFQATGGPVTRNKTYMVGERGPELFMPNASGQIVNNNRTMDALSGAGGTTVNVNVQSQADPTRIGREVAATLRMSGAI
jgi:hypothetical protein